MQHLVVSLAARAIGLWQVQRTGIETKRGTPAGQRQTFDETPMAWLRDYEFVACAGHVLVALVSQGDPSKAEIRVLHGEDPQRLFAGAKPDILYVPVRAGDYKRLPRLEE